MLLHRIEIDGLYSFGTGARRFEMAVHDPVTAVVGPNGSGKSSLARVLNLVQAAVRYNDTGNQQERQTLYALLQGSAINARHHGMASTERSTVRLDIEFTSQVERRLLVSYVRAAVYSSIVGNHGNSVDPAPLEDWVERQITEDQLVALFRGCVIISHSGIVRTDWEVRYEFEHQGRHFVWFIDTSNPNAENVIADASAAPDINTIQGLSLRLTGQQVPAMPVTLPSADSRFTLATLLPGEDGSFRVVVDPINANYAPAPMREFVAAAGIVAPVEDPSQLYGRRYGVAAVFRRVLEQGIVLFGAQGSYRDPQAVGVGYGLYPAALLGQPLASRDGQLLPARLFQLKNGGAAARRRYDEVRSLFRELAPGREFEVVSQVVPQGDQPPMVQIQVEVLPTASAPRELALSIELAGTGVEQALSIAEAIEGSSDRVLVLDEPAVNLHPAWQRLVRARLRRGPGQFLLVTHSPYLVSADSLEDLAAVVRFRVTDGATEARHISLSQLTTSKWAGPLVKEISWSADARSLLFASGVVLVEGETELAALPAWFAKSGTAATYRSPDDIHIAFYSVNGDQSFGHMIAFLENFGVPWSVVCDGAAFRFDISSNILQQVLETAHEPGLATAAAEIHLDSCRQEDMDQTLFDGLRLVGHENGVFTLAPGWNRRADGDDQESFEAYLRSRSDLATSLLGASKQAPRSKARQGRIVADECACPPEVDTLYRDVLEHLWAKGMPRLPAL